MVVEKTNLPRSRVGQDIRVSAPRKKRLRAAEAYLHIRAGTFRPIFDGTSVQGGAFQGKPHLAGPSVVVVFDGENADQPAPNILPFGDERNFLRHREAGVRMHDGRDVHFEDTLERERRKRHPGNAEKRQKKEARCQTNGLRKRSSLHFYILSRPAKS